jgi:predicted nuclease with TOPRIM domain
VSHFAGVLMYTALIVYRKLRNRVSQQAFRRRQSEYIKQLERKAKEHKPDNERIIELEKENQSLRESLIHCHTKLESLRATICTLGDGIAQALDGPVSIPFNLSISLSMHHLTLFRITQEGIQR